MLIVKFDEVALKFCNLRLQLAPYIEVRTLSVELGCIIKLMTIKGERNGL